MLYTKSGDNWITPSSIGTTYQGKNELALVRSEDYVKEWVSGTLPISITWKSICWSPELGLFCAVAAGSDIAATSPDGKNWTQQTLPVTANWYSVCWSPELGLFCAISWSSDIAATSPDGTNWTQRKLPVSANWRSICWSPELGLFCAVVYDSAIAVTSYALPSVTPLILL